ncbi:MAG: protein-disulfide reductase DsbD, partial [Candidatus Obscuribacterales bacterium]|nr:protein-disulfide reductase DsbD [Steroidobacteraceae bacterium]
MKLIAIKFWLAQTLGVVLLASVASTVPAQQSSVTQGGGLKSLLSKDNTGITSNENDFLPPDKAFQFSATMTRPDAIVLQWIIADDYYLYRDRTKISIDGDTKLVQLGATQYPEGKTKHDEYFGDMVVYYHDLKATIPVARGADASGQFKLKVTYQGCADAGLCYNPITKFVTLDLPKASTSSALGKPSDSAGGGTPIAEQDKLAAIIKTGSLPYVLGFFFLAGALLSLTPCVLPMIPILSGIIVGQGDKVTPLRGFSLAFTYVQGMALTYAAAGAIFVLAFKQAPQAFFQHPAIIIGFSVLFVVLAFAMFGAFTLQMPSALQSRLSDASNQQKGGTYVGTFVMGALSALIVTACVAPAMIAALSVISQTGQVARGAGALYTMGLGMGLPLLLVGASAGTLLPKAGAWMDAVKSVFGVMFLGLAIYLLGPLLPATVTMTLWATLAIVFGFWLFSLTLGSRQAPSVVRGFGVLTLVYGIALLIGALAGRSDPLQPLAGIAQAGASTGGTAVEHASSFKRVKSVADLDREIAAANAAGKWVMFDFYADWCVSCKEMEKYTFAEPKVAALLAPMVLLQAD